MRFNPSFDRLAYFESLTFPRSVEESIRRDFALKSDSYPRFMEQLYSDLDRAIQWLQQGPELRQNDTEVRLSAEILGQLRMVGYAATAETISGGHVDMSVSFGAHSWIGEAKKDSKFEEGLKQLTTRYRPASGNFSHNEGGLIFYLVKHDNALGRLNAWRERLERRGSTCTACTCNTLAFYSEHKLGGSGTSFKIRSMAVVLFHQPEDRSARTSAKQRTLKQSSAAAHPPRSNRSDKRS